MKDIRVAVVGFGGMGRLYADMIDSQKIVGMRLTGICCRNQKGQQFIAERYPTVAIYAEAEAMFADTKGFDALIIAVPHKEHIPYLERALQQGIPVLCEKPLTVSLSEAQKLHQKDAEDTAFAMIFNWRTRPIYRKLKEMMDSGCLGTLTHVVWISNFWYRAPAYHRLAAWRSSWRGEGGGLLINQMQHVFDIWQWLFGMPDAVISHVEFGKYSAITVDDSAELLFEYANGLRGVCVASSGESPGSNYLEIHGSNGKCVADGEALFWYENETSTQEFAKRTDGSYTGIPCTKVSVPIAEAGEQYEEYHNILQNFADHLLHQQPLIAQGVEGERALEMANGAYLSTWLKQRVTYPIDGAMYQKMLLEKMDAEQKGC